MKKFAKVVSLLGAFNYEVGLMMEKDKLNEIYLELIKRFALVAETAAEGAGSLFLETINQTPYEKILKKSFEYNLESIIVYGKKFNQLLPKDRAHVKDLQIIGESSHFSRIMDVDDIKDKKLVGVPDAGNQRMVRMLLNVVRYREDLGLKNYWPLTDKILVDTKPDYSIPFSPVLERSSFPYIGVVIYANEQKIASNLVTIFQRLICSYPLEVSFVLIEEWLMNNRIMDKDISINCIQILNENNLYKIKLGSLGKGTFIVGTDKNNRIIEIHENKENIAVGQLDGQVKHSFLELIVEPYTQILAFPGIVNIDRMEDTNLLLSQQKSKTQKKLKQNGKNNEFNFVSLKINPKKITPIVYFKWDKDHINRQLDDFFQTIEAINPEIINIQYGHLHSDREASKDQEVGAIITQQLVEQFNKREVKIVSMPMVDNYHVADRIDLKAWINFLEKHSNVITTEPTFESALITRHLADEVLYSLQKNDNSKVKNIGGNVYYDAGDHCRIELYDGVGEDYNLAGRMGCVPFEIGYELYRLNPELASKSYRDYILNNFPNSLIARWWKKDITMSYQQLIAANIYCLEPRDRIEVKKQKDLEIDVPYKDKVLKKNGSIVEDIFNKTDLSKIVLIHVMENFYNAQHAKFSTLWNECSLPKLNLWRIGFNRYKGSIEILDTNIDKKAYQKIVGQQNN